MQSEQQRHSGELGCPTCVYRSTPICGQLGILELSYRVAQLAHAATEMAIGGVDDPVVNAHEVFEPCWQERHNQCVFTTCPNE